MKFVRHEFIHTDTKDIPDEEIFTVYREKDRYWAFGFKVRGQFTITKFQSEKAKLPEVKQARKQILFCKTYGWSFTGQRVMNEDTFEVDPLFMCIFCKNPSFDISKPCVCRNKSAESLLKKTESGIILSI